jgi:hypothetical protein
MFDLPALLYPITGVKALSWTVTSAHEQKLGVVRKLLLQLG